MNRLDLFPNLYEQYLASEEAKQEASSEAPSSDKQQPESPKALLNAFSLKRIPLEIVPIPVSMIPMMVRQAHQRYINAGSFLWVAGAGW